MMYALWRHVADAAGELVASKDPLRRALGAHLCLVGDVLLSLDGEEEGEAIRAVLGERAVPLALAEIRADAERLLRQVIELTKVGK